MKTEALAQTDNYGKLKFLAGMAACTPLFLTSSHGNAATSLFLVQKICIII